TARSAYLRKAAIRPDNPKVKHVPTHSHSDRWIGASGAWGNAWSGVGKIRRGQGIHYLRCGAASCSHRRLCERVGPRGKCCQGGRRYLRDNSSGERSARSSHRRSGRGQRLQSYRHVMAWTQRTFHAATWQRDKQGADLRENPSTGLSVKVQPSHAVALEHLLATRAKAGAPHLKALLNCAIIAE